MELCNISGLPEEISLEAYTSLLDVFNTLSAVVYISNLDDYEMLFLNDYGKNILQNEQYCDQKCYEVLKKKAHRPCDECLDKLHLKSKKGSSARSEKFTFFDNNALAIDKLVKWPDGRDARLRILIEQV